MLERPGGPLGRRPLHFFWIVDCSGSMAADGKMQALNNAVKEAVPHMIAVASENPHAEVFVRVLRFADGAQWQVVNPTRPETFTWTDLSAGGMTDLGRALTLLADELDVSRIGNRGFPPVLALVSDGMPTDDFDAGLKALLDKPWGKRAIRIAIAIGQDADRDMLRRFIGNAEVPVLEANNPEALRTYIRFVSTAVLENASSPPSQSHGATGGAAAAVIPPPPPAVPAAGVDDVW